MPVLILLTLLFSLLPIPALCQDFAKSSSLKIAYPRNAANIQAPSTFIVGQTRTGDRLICNGETVHINKAGFFAHVVPLSYGTNHFLLTDPDNNEREDLTIFRKPPPPAIKATQLKMEGVKPDVDLGVTAGDNIGFSVKATPHSTVSVRLGNIDVALNPLPKGQSAKMDVAYGKTYKQYESNDSDLYKGSYRVKTSDHFFGLHPEFKVINRLGTLSSISKASINTVETLLIAHTANNPTIVRLGPDLARTTPLDERVKISIDGWQGKNVRCLYAPNKHVWIKKEELILDLQVPRTDLGQNYQQLRTTDNAAPQAVAQTINILEDPYGPKISVPLTERLPYQIEQKMNPNCLILKIFGVASDTDWITAEPKQDDTNQSIIDNITWRQAEDNVYEVIVHLLGGQQWGYKVYYEGNNLCLGIKAKPKITQDGALQGLKICIDPGHGGAERGSIGCSGLPESKLNLEISLKVKQALEALGASVIMTRTSQSENPALAERVRFATEKNADFLISIHNNSLPDGRDPWTEHGTSSYWYHPQSIELAKYLKDAVKRGSNFLDLGARYQNLALARGTSMPSVLLEIGFMINPDEFSELINPDFQEKIAQSIGRGLKDYCLKALQSDSSKKENYKE